MDIALPRKAWRERPESVRSLENWLLCWILLPNAGYWLLWIVGGPPRPLAILLTGLLGIVTHRAPFWAKAAAFLAATAASAVFFVSALFNLSVVSLVHSLQFATELSFAASFEYLICAAAVAGTLAIAWRALRRPTALVHPRKMVIAAAATLLAVSADVAMSEGARGSYHRSAAGDSEFTSATGGSGLMRFANGDRHVLLVMVEAMGQPVEPALRARLVDLWARPEVRARYEVTTGETLFFGSTTGGEIRELCGRWGEYHDLAERADPSCLPARLAARGYRTRAWHSFKGSFFDRTDWYPNIGFQEMRFGPEMVAAGAEICPGVFPGACDHDVPAQIGTALRRAERPQFLYWLTVSSHLPVLEDAQLHTEACERFDAALAEDYPMTCRLFRIFDEVGSALAREIAAPGFPETDILIVGDHTPPFFDRHHRTQYAPDRVPWILLRPKPAPPPDRLAAR